MPPKKASIYFVLMTVLVDTIGIGIIVPVIPELIRSITEVTLGEAAFYGGLLATIYSLFQFICAPILGELSDRYGRRPVLLMSLLGLGIDFLFFAFAPSLLWLFIGRIIAGMAGASHTVATAYIADISTKEEKAKNFGLIGAAFGVGFIIGPLIGSVFVQYGVTIPFFVAAGMTLLNFLYGLFFVPESLPIEKRRKIDYKRMIPGVSIINLSKYTFGGLILAFFLSNLAAQALPSTWAYFTMESYDWSPAEVGYSLSVIGLFVAIVQGGLIGTFVKKFGTKKVIMMGFVFWTIGMFLISIAFESWLLFIFIIPYILGGVASPTLQGLLSNYVSEKEQGNLQGALTGMISITAIIGPFLCTTLFYFFTVKDTTHYFPGAPYLFGAVILLIGTLITKKSLRKLNGDDL